MNFRSIKIGKRSISFLNLVHEIDRRHRKKKKKENTRYCVYKKHTTRYCVFRETTRSFLKSGMAFSLAFERDHNIFFFLKQKKYGEIVFCCKIFSYSLRSEKKSFHKIRRVFLFLQKTVTIAAIRVTFWISKSCILVVSFFHSRMPRTTQTQLLHMKKKILERYIGKELTREAAASLLGIHPNALSRLKKRYQEYGESALLGRKPGPRRGTPDNKTQSI